jgi:hypothetical protein
MVMLEDEKDLKREQKRNTLSDAVLVHNMETNAPEVSYSLVA